MAGFERTTRIHVGLRQRTPPRSITRKAIAIWFPGEPSAGLRISVASGTRQAFDGRTSDLGHRVALTESANARRGELPTATCLKVLLPTASSRSARTANLSQSALTASASNEQVCFGPVDQRLCRKQIARREYFWRLPSQQDRLLNVQDATSGDQLDFEKHLVELLSFLLDLQELPRIATRGAGQLLGRSGGFSGTGANTEILCGCFGRLSWDWICLSKHPGTAILHWTDSTGINVWVCSREIEPLTSTGTVGSLIGTLHWPFRMVCPWWKSAARLV